MIIGISHDINTKEGHLSIAAKLNNNLDGKLMLPSGGEPIATLVASHRYKTVWITYLFVYVSFVFYLKVVGVVAKAPHYRLHTTKERCTRRGMLPGCPDEGLEWCN